MTDRPEHIHDTDCEQALRDVETFLDGELPPEQYREVLDHLDDCMDCFHAFDFQAELKEIIARKCGGDEMPPELLERIRDSLAVLSDAADPPPAG
jgi:anti-sigma factor (TIGR02949 family)